MIPRPDDVFTDEFVGRVVAIEGGHIRVTDQDDNTWDVDRDQLLSV